MAKRQGTTEGKAALSAEQKALNNALSQIEKTFGTGAIMKLGENTQMEVEGISTGALSLDLALGGKGLPRGRHGRAIRAGIEREDDDCTARRGPGAVERRRGGVHRCRARA